MEGRIKDYRKSERYQSLKEKKLRGEMNGADNAKEHQKFMRGKKVRHQS